MRASWLVLERYALGECDPDEARAVESQLVADPEIRAMFVAIRGDRRVPPPLPIPHRRRPLLAAVVLLAAVALVAVGLQRPDGAVKGGDLALELVGVRDGLATPLSDVTVGDSVGLRLTCPPGRTDVDVVVFHGGEVAFPFDAVSVPCGNRVPIPGAFSVDRPGRLDVCVAVGALPSRAILATGPSAADVCVTARVIR